MRRCNSVREFNGATDLQVLACTAALLLTIIGSGSVSADVSVPPATSTSTTAVEQFDEVTGIIWSWVFRWMKRNSDLKRTYGSNPG